MFEKLVKPVGQRRPMAGKMRTALRAKRPKRRCRRRTAIYAVVCFDVMAALARGKVIRRRRAGDNTRRAQLTTCFNSPFAYFSAIFVRLIALIFEPCPAQLNS